MAGDEESTECDVDTEINDKNISRQSSESLETTVE